MALCPYCGTDRPIRLAGVQIPPAGIRKTIRVMWRGSGPFFNQLDGLDMAQLGSHIARIHKFRDEFGTTQQPFKIFTTGASAFTAQGIGELEEIGVTDVVIGFRNLYESEPDKPLDEKIAMLNWYASEFMDA